MDVRKACYLILDQIGSIIGQISEEDLSKPVQAFTGITIGQHFRHSIEFLQCLKIGYKRGVINYDDR
ncbi:MAG: hypothetical protein ABFS32_06495, partial [Bacteroidota bacterium]